MTNDDYQELITRLSEANQCLVNHPFDEAIGDLESKITTDLYRIAVIGDFSTGKSTFINALIGEELLYSANIEATGVVTTLRYGEKPMARVVRKKEKGQSDEIVEEIDLSNGDGRARLSEKLDIRNTKKSEQIDIFYPLQGINRDIVFYDTPGIENLSKKQLIMTKNIIGETNAVIFLITKKGFTDTAMKVITGKHDVIGRITTKDIIVVMTHIGEIYDERKTEYPERKIAGVVENAQRELSNNGLNGIMIKPLDSRDYLWGTNLQCYEKEAQTRDCSTKGPLLPQEEYIKRSRFEEFKEFLFGFLDKDNLKKSRENDICNSIYLLAEAIETELKKQHDTEARDIASNLERIDKQIEQACENQRKFYNRLILQLKKHMGNFLDSVEKDVEEEKKQNAGVLALINETFNSIDDINENNVRKCIDATVSSCERLAKKMEKETNVHLMATNRNFINERFSSEFQKIFDKEIAVDFKEINCDFSIILEPATFDAEALISDLGIRELREEKECLMVALQQAKQQLDSLEDKRDKSQIECRAKEENVESWYEKEIKALGKRPKATQKYRNVTKTEGFLIFKKTWTDKVPDGLDYSKRNAWDEKMKALLEEFNKRNVEVLEIMDTFEILEIECTKLKNTILFTEKKVSSIDAKINKIEALLDEERQKNADYFVSEKKEEVAAKCDEIRDELSDQIIEKIRLYINDCGKAMSSQIKEESGRQIIKYQGELEELNKSISSTISVSIDVLDKLLGEITSIKEVSRNESRI
jgi:GTPase SAR1 family protein